MIKVEIPKTPAQLQQERREEERKEKFVDSVTALMANLALLPLHAWILMLVLGAVHSVIAPVAAVGYGTALLFVLGVDLVAVTSKKFRR
ncbi:hypothetical protein AB0K92_16090 [Streptomyces sp. NPDC052687]|uniref:hypothetical protein n=1 Tax=Streptomyces sp. NPDC052687 TaxID=3154759 RepID=UPI003438C827